MTLLKTKPLFGIVYGFGPECQTIINQLFPHKIATFINVFLTKGLKHAYLNMDSFETLSSSKIKEKLIRDNLLSESCDGVNDTPISLNLNKNTSSYENDDKDFKIKRTVPPKKKRDPTPYQKFVGEEMRKLRITHPNLKNKTYMTMACDTWNKMKQGGDIKKVEVKSNVVGKISNSEEDEESKSDDNNEKSSSSEDKDESNDNEKSQSSEDDKPKAVAKKSRTSYKKSQSSEDDEPKPFAKKPSAYQQYAMKKIIQLRKEQPSLPNFAYVKMAAEAWRNEKLNESKNDDDKKSDKDESENDD